MGRWTREEIQEALDLYSKTALEAGTSGDWNPWADLFTEDATYVEHLYGTFGGREAIRKWISSTMAEWPNHQMQYFPHEWAIIDEERGWVVAQIWNRMVDPGDGSVHQSYNYTLLKYAGNMQWSFEEDIYNPDHFRTMIRGWFDARKRCKEAAGA
ncbi:MAG: nuclear transport factor 2 family protein [Myxococcota bacterium]|nr:nuclear transport factor 2 family protein [Myxococcota bacterium]